MTEEEEFEFRLRLEKEREMEKPATTAGAELARGTKTAVRGVIRGVAAVPAMMSDAVTGVINTVTPKGAFKFQQAMPALDNALARIGLPPPANTAEAVGEGLITGVTTGGTAPVMNVLSRLPQASSALQAIGQGAGVGALGGLTAPTGDPMERIQNAGVGAALGGGLTAGGMGLSNVLSFIKDKSAPLTDLFTKKGPENIVRRYVGRSVGEPNMPAVLGANRDAAQIIPGGAPTVAETVAAVPEGSPVVALQDIVAKTKGGPSAQFGQRILDQQTAVKGAKEARSATSAVNYGKAFDPAIHKLKPDGELAAIADNPYFQSAAPTADKLAAAKGINPEDNLTEILHYVKVGLDKRLRGGMGEVPIDNAERAAITDVKNRLVTWLAKNNKDYETGRSAYAAASKDIDAFLARQELAKNPLQATNLGGGVNIGEETRPHLPNLLSRPAMIANFVMKRAGFGVEPKVDAALTRILLNPSEFDQVMSTLPQSSKQNVLAGLKAANAQTFAIGASQ